MDPDQWKDILNYGVPLFLLLGLAIWLARYVVQPFLGSNGIIAEYFARQSIQYERQGDIAEKHQKLTDELSKVCVQHHDRADQFYSRTDINMSDLLQIHQHIVSAMSTEFSDQRSKDELARADAIIRRHLKSN